ncbi:MAG: hypothetical protein PG981_001554 [Wolbachia endosymbiont of Ctenocephalides orientis wCori]|nr:MAG: hypothetical protein PG981_001554 [Wolbachia endosymbiont of Ctenocephalides orientis wCori]
MLNVVAEKSNNFPQIVHDTYRHKYRQAICVTTGLTTLICKISLQFYCEFIDSNRSNILFIRDTARLIKLPLSILYIFHSAFIIHNLVNNYKKPDSKEELAKIVGKLALLGNSIIGILIQTKIIHFFAADSVSYFRFTSTILFLFISEPISYYYTYKKYEDKKHESEKCTEDKKCTDELNKCKKSLITSTITLSLGLTGFIVDNLSLPIVPINLSNGVIYKFSLGVTISMIMSAMYLMSNVERLLYYDISNNQPPSEVEYVHHHGTNDNVVER